MNFIQHWSMQKSKEDHVSWKINNQLWVINFHMDDIIVRCAVSGIDSNVSQHDHSASTRLYEQWSDRTD